MGIVYVYAVLEFDTEAFVTVNAANIRQAKLTKSSAFSSVPISPAIDTASLRCLSPPGSFFRQFFPVLVVDGEMSNGWLTNAHVFHF